MALTPSGDRSVGVSRLRVLRGSNVLTLLTGSPRGCLEFRQRPAQNGALGDPDQLSAIGGTRKAMPRMERPRRLQELCAPFARAHNQRASSGAVPKERACHVGDG